MNQQALAKHFDVSATTVGQWVHKGVPHTRTKTGAYHFDPNAVQRWRTQNGSPRSRQPSTLSEARTRKEAAMAGLRELQLKQKTGELVTRASVTKATFAVIRTARDKFFNIPDRVAGVLAAETNQATIHAILTKEIHHILTELSNAPPR